MRFKPLLNREHDKKQEKKEQDKKPQAEDMGRRIQKIEIQLSMLEKKYTTILSRELAAARINKNKNIKNSANYSRIGVAYYSLNILTAARERLHEMKSSQELYDCVNEMGAAISMINGLNGKIGKVDAAAVAKGMKKMSGQSAGAGRDLVSALSKLSEINTERTDKTPIEALVSVDVIEKLISGDDIAADDLLQRGEGLTHSPDEVLDLCSEILGEQNDGGGTVNDEDLDSLTMDIEGLIGNLK